MAKRNHALPRQKTNQDVESLIHSTDWPKETKPGRRILDTLDGFLGKTDDALSDIAISAGPRGRQRNRRRRRSRGGARNHRFRRVLEQFCLMVSVTAGQPVGLADTRPGCRIVNTFDGVSERNYVLRREHNNQGVESLILSTECPQEPTFYVRHMTTRVQNPCYSARIVSKKRRFT